MIYPLMIDLVNDHLQIQFYNNIIDNGYSYCKHKIQFITYLYSTQQQQSTQELSNEPKEETLSSHSTQQGNVRHNSNHCI